ncbi:MAG: DMT family transporter [Rhodobacterales bacterium]|nr:DMT family transporter [Pseudomonadota bacterium]MDA1287636.1 DMT family transporter [Pseudomonadota bacterium]
MAAAHPAKVAAAEPTRALVIRAVIFLLMSILFFDAMSIAVRHLLDRYSAQELSAYRNFLGVLPSLVVMVWVGELRLRGTNLRIRQWKLALLRGLIVAAAQLFYYASLGHLEYATVITLSFAGPLIVVTLSVPILGERVGIWRWGAVLIGFVGVLLVLRPGADTFTPAALLPIGAALCYALSTMTVRKFDSNVSNALVYLYSSVAAAGSALVLALITTRFSPVQDFGDAGLILFMGLSGGVGVLCLMLGFRLVSPSIVAPFQYFGLISALLIGYFVFGELPVTTLFPGVLFIVGSGFIILWREGRNKT